ncbi:MAG: hypothetical protein JST47_08825 [Bacteroidetes bacterium]|nr:hypothetical protein [Bacteroidota bacterium]MBS1973616.1 hypothetical protein [Bacteroidota bacterium]
MNSVKDLSSYHYLLSDFFKTPKSQAEWDRYKLTDEQVGFFRENGYLSGIKMLEEWQVDELCRGRARFPFNTLPSI